MSLLFCNDRSGTYPSSWYAASTTELQPFPALEGDLRADVCIIGAGFTGVSAALHMAEAGLNVIVLDAHRVGFGASGRNGGQLGSGQRKDQRSLEKMIGDARAKEMWDLGEAAKSLVCDLAARHKIDCHLKPGIAWAATDARSARWTQYYAEHLNIRYGADVQPLSRDEVQTLCPSPRYVGGMLDMSAAHLHPLALALGLAKAADDAGAQIFENSFVTHIEDSAKPIVHTKAGRVTCDHVVLAGNGYIGGLNRRVAARVMPINNFIVATEPLGAKAREIISQDVAICDDLFVVNYFRLSHDGRLLFGGGESYSDRFPKDIAAKVRTPMEATFPQLKGISIDYAWGGTLGITAKRLPHLERVSKTIISAAGYSGHGVGNAVQAGKFLAEAVKEQSAGFDAFATLPCQPFPGGPALRAPLLVLAMSWFALRDRFGF